MAIKGLSNKVSGLGGQVQQLRARKATLKEEIEQKDRDADSRVSNLELEKGQLEVENTKLKEDIRQLQLEKEATKFRA